MIEKFSLRIFWMAMLLCALTVLSAVWVPFDESGDWIPVRMRFVLTFFVIGLASFLIWAPIVAYRFHHTLNK